MTADLPGTADILAVTPTGYTVALTYCPCGAVVGECGCDAVWSEFVASGRSPIFVPYGRTHR